jgi:hypothetical protein
MHRSQSLPFQKVQHKVTTNDAQPSVQAGALLVSVTGMLVVRPLVQSLSDAHPCATQVDDSPNPLQFSQIFHLIPEGGSYYVCVSPQLS